MASGLPNPTTFKNYFRIDVLPYYLCNSSINSYFRSQLQKKNLPSIVVPFEDCKDLLERGGEADTPSVYENKIQFKIIIN